MQTNNAMKQKQTTKNHHDHKVLQEVMMPTEIKESSSEASSVIWHKMNKKSDFVSYQFGRNEAEKNKEQ